MALSSSLTLTSREAAAISSYEPTVLAMPMKTTIKTLDAHQRDFIMMAILKILVDSISWETDGR